MKTHAKISITIVAWSAAALLGACGASGGDDAATTSTSVLPDGSVEVYEVDDQGEIIGTVAPTGTRGDATDAGSDGSTGNDGTTSSDGEPSAASADDSTESPAPAADGEPGGVEDDPFAPEAAPAPAPQPEATTDGEPEPEPEPAATAPTVAVTRQTCNGANLIVSLTANAGNDYRKGIKAVSVARQNEYGVFLTSNAQWLGPETGAGNVWNGTLVGNRQNIGKVLKVTATSAAGQSTTVEVPITAPC